MTPLDGEPHIRIEGRDSLKRTPAHGVALDCLAAGIETTHPERVVREALSLSEGELRVTDVGGETIAYDIDVFE